MNYANVAYDLLTYKAIQHALATLTMENSLIANGVIEKCICSACTNDSD